jgi:Xaa-Pro dipeptidase
MDKDRIARVREAMAEAELDALVCRLPENVLLLSGYWPLSGWSFLLLPRDETAVCVAPHCEEREAKEELWEARCVTYRFGVLNAPNPYDAVAGLLDKAVRGEPYGRVGIEGTFENVAPPWNVAEPAIPAGFTRGLLESVFGCEALVDATDLLHGLRARKTPAEQDKLRRTNTIAQLGMEAFHDEVKPGVSGVELVAHVEHAVMTKGTVQADARRVRAFAQVATGAAETSMGYRPMEIATTRKMAEGDLALLELAVVADGFWCDRTRVAVAGTPADQQREVFEAVVRAQEAAIAAVRSGVRAGEVDEAARSVIREAGYDEGFFHVTGHGLGFRYHEPAPLIAPVSEEVLETGMCHTVEPGVYLPEIGGIRVEDNVVVTENGAEVLGPFRKELC